MNRFPLLMPFLLLVWAGGTAMAQQTMVIQAENVRYAYAQVLRVTPVYQTLTATRTELRCEPAPEPSESSRMARVVGAVKGAVKDAVKDVLKRDEPAEDDADCRSVPVEREFRRPIAYDVDYTYKGAKYRSRLAEDPGDRLRIRVSVSPVLPSVSVTRSTP